MLAKLRELIEDLPEILRPLAGIYADVLDRAGTEEIGRWVRDAMIGDWRDAHDRLVRIMSTGELLRHQAAINQCLKRMNDDNATFVAAQRDALLDLLVAALSLA